MSSNQFHSPGPEPIPTKEDVQAAHQTLSRAVEALKRNGSMDVDQVQDAFRKYTKFPRDSTIDKSIVKSVNDLVSTCCHYNPDVFKNQWFKAALGAVYEAVTYSDPSDVLIGIVYSSKISSALPFLVKGLAASSNGREKLADYISKCCEALSLKPIDQEWDEKNQPNTSHGPVAAALFLMQVPDDLLTKEQRSALGHYVVRRVNQSFYEKDPLQQRGGNTVIHRPSEVMVNFNRLAVEFLKKVLSDDTVVQVVLDNIQVPGLGRSTYAALVFPNAKGALSEPRVSDIQKSLLSSAQDSFLTEFSLDSWFKIHRETVVNRLVSMASGKDEQVAFASLKRLARASHRDDIHSAMEELLDNAALINIGWAEFVQYFAPMPLGNRLTNYSTIAVEFATKVLTPRETRTVEKKWAWITVGHKTISQLRDPPNDGEIRFALAMLSVIPEKDKGGNNELVVAALGEVRGKKKWIADGLSRDMLLAASLENSEQSLLEFRARCVDIDMYKKIEAALGRDKMTQTLMIGKFDDVLDHLSAIRERYCRTWGTKQSTSLPDSVCEAIKTLYERALDSRSRVRCIDFFAVVEGNAYNPGGSPLSYWMESVTSPDPECVAYLSKHLADILEDQRQQASRNQSIKYKHYQTVLKHFCARHVPRGS